MEYIGADNRAHRPIMIHRAILGSVELLCHAFRISAGICRSGYALQMILPITDAQIEYAKEIQKLRKKAYVMDRCT